MKRYWPAILVSLAFIAIAPFIGQIRDLLKTAFPGSFVRIVGGFIAAAVVVVFVTAVLRIRERRIPRYGALVASLALSVWYIYTFSTGLPDVDAVERFHFLQYGLIGALFYRAARPACPEHSRRACPEHSRGAGDPSVPIITLLCGTLVGIADEWVQCLVPVRSGDVRDIQLNAFATMCGLVFALGLWPPERWTWSMDTRAWRRVSRLAACVIVAFAVFIHVAHLGYEIADDEGVRFRSFFTRDGLQRLRTRRAEEWRVDPPRKLKALAIEDFYVTEGGWHALYRNVGYAKGDFLTAWKENWILEKYYEPFLGLHSFSRPDEVHRWPDAQRTEVEEKAGPGRDAPYVSEPGLDRVFVRPTRPVFWMMVALIVVSLIGWPSLRRR